MYFGESLAVTITAIRWEIVSTAHTGNVGCDVASHGAGKEDLVRDDARVDWRTLCELAAQEDDPKKLLDLVEQINKALDERNGVRWLPEMIVKFPHAS
jgi:hypothetical protein